MDSELLKYFMAETNRQLLDITQRLDDLQKFKVEMIAQATAASKTASMIVSGVCGFITLMASCLLVYYTRHA